MEEDDNYWDFRQKSIHNFAEMCCKEELRFDNKIAAGFRTFRAIFDLPEAFESEDEYKAVMRIEEYERVNGSFDWIIPSSSWWHQMAEDLGRDVQALKIEIIEHGKGFDSNILDRCMYIGYPPYVSVEKYGKEMRAIIKAFSDDNRESFERDIKSRAAASYFKGWRGLRGGIIWHTIKNAPWFGDSLAVVWNVFMVANKWRHKRSGFSFRKVREGLRYWFYDIQNEELRRRDWFEAGYGYRVSQ